MQKILNQVQDLEHAGYEFEAAEASFDILVKKALGHYRPAFERVSYRVNIEANEQHVLGAAAPSGTMPFVWRKPCVRLRLP